MAVLVVGPESVLNMTQLEIEINDITSASASRIYVLNSLPNQPETSIEFLGSFTFDAGGNLNGGTITQVSSILGGVNYFTLSGLSFSAPAFLNFVDNDDLTGLLSALFIGNDTLTGAAGGDFLIGYSGADTIDGGGGNDFLFGTVSTDVLIGGDGNDYLNGGADVDRLTGGAGIDVFGGLRSDLASDIITDMTAEDVILVQDGVLADFSFDLDEDAIMIGEGQFIRIEGDTNGRIVAQNSANGLLLTVAPDAADHDFNGDQRSDILWRNADGRLTDWYATGDGGFNGATGILEAVSTDWKIVGDADFNRDGLADILWRNDNGTLTTWLGTGTGFNNQTANYSVGTDWKVVETGDFNGDARSDILWRNDNGDLTTWLSTGDTFDNNTFLLNVSTDWKVAGTGDFNDDDLSDILWRNDNGSLTTWLSTGSGFNSQTASYSVGTDWTVAGVAVLDDKDGFDILWRNDNGDLTFWSADEFGTGNFDNQTAIINVGTDWKVEGTGDVNGDGMSDILWRNDNGGLTDWTANGQFFDAANFYTVVDPSWSVFL